MKGACSCELVSAHMMRCYEPPTSQLLDAFSPELKSLQELNLPWALLCPDLCLVAGMKHLDHLIHLPPSPFPPTLCTPRPRNSSPPTLCASDTLCLLNNQHTPPAQHQHKPLPVPSLRHLGHQTCCLVQVHGQLLCQLFKVSARLQSKKQGGSKGSNNLMAASTVLCKGKKGEFGKRKKSYAPLCACI